MFFKRIYCAGATLAIGAIIWAGIYFLASRWIPYFVPALYWSLAVAVANFLIFYFFRDTRYEIFGLNLIGYLELANLLVFCAWGLNILARVVNIIPFVFGRELWVSYLASGPWMFAFFWSIFVFLFSVLLASYWDEKAYLARRQY